MTDFSLPLKILLLGYNGATNTGSEARLLAIIDDVRAVFGQQVEITVPSLNEQNLRRYIVESPTLKIAPLPTVYPLAIQRLVKDTDLLLLVEGSCYMDSWTSALLWAFLWATRCAHAYGKPSLAYAVDAGNLSSINQWLVRNEASKTDMIATRNSAAADLLTSWGVKATIKVTGDTAFYYKTDESDSDMLDRVWSGSGEVIGIAPVDFYRWPVVVRLWGSSADCYRWPYYYSTSAERSASTESLVTGVAHEADRLVKDHGKRVVLIGMEGLDEPICRRIHEAMNHRDDARIFTALEYNASQMTSILRRLSLLVTSRYHAAVLSMKASVPIIAVAHDTRLCNLMGEAGLKDYLLEYNDPTLFDKLSGRLDNLLEDPAPTCKLIATSHDAQLARAGGNRDLLRQVALSHGLKVTQ